MDPANMMKNIAKKGNQVTQNNVRKAIQLYKITQIQVHL
jgi:hypothetical protein